MAITKQVFSLIPPHTLMKVCLKLVSAIFYQMFIFHQMIGLQKL